MEIKLCVALCALLLASCGCGEGPAAASSVAPETPAASSLESSSLAATAPPPSSPDSRLHPRVTGRPSSNTTTAGETTSVTPAPHADNDTNTVSLSEASGAEEKRNLTDQLTSQPPVPPSGSHPPTSHSPLSSTSPPHTAQVAPADTLTTTPLRNTSHHAALPLPDSITPSNKPTHPKVHSSTFAPNPEPPEFETTTPTTPTTTIAQCTSTSSNSSSQKPPCSEPPTPTSGQNTSQSDGHTESSSEARPKSPITPTSSLSAQAKAHDDTPSQLNVGGDTTMVQESPTLDPLLAGLVSAFIITAVVITLLLFLKLRRRDNRPEFRRLQDLPMDDMMEDTPLSMYSY